MAKPTFSLALLWDAKSSPAAVKQLIESLDSHFPPRDVSNIAVTLSQATACLQFSADFSLYVKKTLAQVATDVQKSGGRFIELARLPDHQREAFKWEFLQPNGVAPAPFKQLRGCSRPIEEHLTKLSNGSRKALSAKPNTPVAPARSIQRPRRQTSRYRCNLDVEFPSDNGPIHEQASNISMGGIFIRTNQRPELNSTVGVKIKLPNGQPLQTTARVVHIQDTPDPGGIGLAFSQGDKVFMHLLERYFSPAPKK